MPSAGDHCFLVASNWGDTDVTEVIAPKVGRGRVTDAVTNRPVAVNASGAVELLVPANDFRLLIWE